MNLVGVTQLKTVYSFNEGLNELTVTFTDPTGVTLYGTLVIEINKHRAYTEAMNTIAEAFSTAAEVAKHRVLLDVNNGVATTVFT